MARSYRRLSAADVDDIWVRMRAGHAAKPTARQLGLSTGTVRAYLVRCGGIRPDPRRRPRGSAEFRRARGDLSGSGGGARRCGDRRWARTSPSTISREVAAHGGRRRYRAAAADQRAWSRATRPKVCKLATNPALACIVAEKLAAPVVTAADRRLAEGHLSRRPGDAGVARDIYRTLFVQSRGALRKELTAYLRTGRVIRRPQGVRLPDGRGGRPGILHISERPAEAEDRAVPGHWEGDLVFGKHMSPVATLVERSTRFVMLVALPGGDHKADASRRRPRRSSEPLPEPAGQVLDLGPGTRDGRSTPTVHHRHRDRGLLLRPQDPVAARQQREHQRPAAPISTSPARLPDPDPGRLRRHRPRAQRTSSTDPRLQDTITSTGRGVALTA